MKYLLLGLVCLLAACGGVPTGTKSPCYGEISTCDWRKF